jgi:hypothetical protein
VVIREIERFVIGLKCSKFVGKIVDAVERVHQTLSLLEPDVDETMSTLPKEFSIEELRAAMKPPPPPAAPSVKSELDGYDAHRRARAQAKVNLQWSDLTASSLAGASIQGVWVALALINHDFWCYARDLLDPSARCDMGELKRKMNTHIKATAIALQTSKDCVNVMSVELRSCQTLVIWITFCWGHRIAKEMYPVFKKYSAALNHDDLCHMVLQEADAAAAVENVQTYLQQNRMSAKFPFRNHCDTLDLAVSMSNESSEWRKSVVSIYMAEKEAAENQIQERYETILNDQEVLGVLDQQLVDAKAEVRSAEVDFAHSQSRDFTWERGRKIREPAYYQYRDALDHARAVVCNVERRISELDKRPPDILFPLPRNMDKALQWLFFFFYRPSMLMYCSWHILPKLSCGAELRPCPKVRPKKTYKIGSTNTLRMNGFRFLSKGR